MNMLDRLTYKIVYRNGSTRDVAEFIRENDGSYTFRYFPNTDVEFPGFPSSEKEYKNDVLWEPIAFRIPIIIRNKYSDIPPEELLEKTSGKLVTDHFEFIKQGV